MARRRNPLRAEGVVILGLATILTACGDAPTATTPETVPATTTRPAPTTSTPISTPTTADDAPTETTEDPMPDDPQLAEAIEAARSELAADLGVDASEIEVEAAERVTWPDGSMGCPEPGMSYTQALVDGVRVLLKANSVTYHFHGAVGSVPMVCASPSIPPPID